MKTEKRKIKARKQSTESVPDIKDIERIESGESSSEDGDVDLNSSRGVQRERRRVEGEKLARTLFVGNLPSWVTKRCLERLFRRALRTDAEALQADCSVESVLMKTEKRKIKARKQSTESVPDIKDIERIESGESSSEDGDVDLNSSRGVQRERRRVEGEKLARTLFVGNLPSWVTKRRLERLFRRALRTDAEALQADCSVESVRIRGAVPVTGGTSKQARKRASIMHEFAAGENHTLIAFVVLTSKQGIPASLKLNGHWLSDGDVSERSQLAAESGNGRHIRVDVCSRQKASFKTNRSIFLGNLPFSVNEEQIRNAFSRYGDIVNVRLVRDSVTGAVKGVGFVEFSDPSMAILAVRGSNNLEVGGRTVRVQFWKSMRKAKLRKGGNSSGSRRHISGNKQRRESSPGAEKPSIVVPSNLRGAERKKYVQRLLCKRKKKAARSGALKAEQSQTTGKKGRMEGKRKKLTA
ncbi:RNA-binding protein 34 [Sparganum proliferum]